MVYNIRDIWHGLNLAYNNFFGLYFLSLPILIISISILNFNFALMWSIWSVVAVLLIVQAFLIYFKNSTYKIDANGYVTFPRSDIENSIFQIIIFAKYWNLMRNRTVHISEIETVYISSEDAGINLDVAGTFGSSRFEFSTKQKRSEVRNALNSSAKRFNSNAQVDNTINVNM